MLLQYETTRCILKILMPDDALSVLEFYEANKRLFEACESDRPNNFYTKHYQEAVLNLEFQGFIQKKLVRFWVYKKTDPQTIIGTISFHDFKFSCFKSCLTGYKFDARCHHKGYAGETLSAACAIIQKELDIHRISAYIMPSNLPSIHLAQSVGFTLVGTIPDYAYLHNHWMAHSLYVLTASEDSQ